MFSLITKKKVLDLDINLESKFTPELCYFQYYSVNEKCPQKFETKVVRCQG